MSGDWRGTLSALLLIFCIVIIRCTETFWSPCFTACAAFKFSFWFLYCSLIDPISSCQFYFYGKPNWFCFHLFVYCTSLAFHETFLLGVLVCEGEAQRTGKTFPLFPCLSSESDSAMYRLASMQHIRLETKFALKFLNIILCVYHHLLYAARPSQLIPPDIKALSIHL